MATVSNIYWTSSSPIFSQTLFTGPSTLAAPDYLFLARAGCNGCDSANPSIAWEQSLTTPGPNVTQTRSTWDPLHGSPGERPFHSIFQVRFVMNADRIRASAGTSPYLAGNQPQFNSIQTIRIAAAVRNEGAPPVAHREVCWESAEITFYYNAEVRANETREFYYLTALPRAASPQRLKTGNVATLDLQAGNYLEQYLELTAAEPNIVGFELVGLVAFRANDPAFPQVTLDPDDLQLKVAVWAPHP